MQKPLIHIVTGPTASGKTKFALELAKKVDGEIINADSRQIYKYLDIGTNKEDLGDISGHLFGFLNPNESFNAHSYREMVYELIPELWAQGKVPIIVGGTGLYIQAVLNPDVFNLSGEPDPLLREELNTLSVIALQQRLEKIDPEVLSELNQSDKNNPRRLIRAIEKSKVVLSTDSIKISKNLHSALENAEIHYIYLPQEVLDEKINSRVVRMWEEGLVDETKKVVEMFGEDALALQGIGYKEVLSYLRGEVAEQECIQKIQIAHRQYSKRQRTWFQKYLDTPPYSPP
jgi:tRNA dimethylallyltransferase